MAGEHRGRLSGQIRPLPGAKALLDTLTAAGIPWAIATSGRMETARVNLDALGVDPDRVPVVTRDMAAAGVGILAGCDALIAGFCLHGELTTMVRAGMTPLAALQTATINPALALWL